MQHTKKSGFTLVELAIVLVIIGLIVGGVLVGQDLIKAAEIRATATQIEKYNTAATAFRTKYDGYPGDLISTRATTFGLAAGAGTDGLSDGDGVLENGGTLADKSGVGGESTLFWVHLTQAQFIPDAFTTATGTVAVAAANVAAIATFLPTLKIRESGFIHTAGINGRNFFYLSNPTAIIVTTGALTEAASSGTLTPIEAENIDAKVDDGGTNTGIIRAYDDLVDATAETAATNAAPAAGVCVSNAAGIPYNLTVGGDTVACRLRWRASF